MFDLKLIGIKIKEIRKRKKISQEKLAEIVSMNHRSIVRLENNHSVPQLETLEKIAEALGVSISDFFENKPLGSRDEIIKDINSCLSSMNDDELKTFYQAVYYFIH